MKQSKPQCIIPWYEFDVPYEKPPTKCWWEKFQHRLERNFWKRFINKEDKIRRQTNAIK